MKTDKETQYYTVQEIANHLRVSQTTIYRYIDKGLLKAIKTEQNYRIPVKEFEKYLKKIEYKGKGGAKKNE